MEYLQALLGELTSGDDARAENALPKILSLGSDAIPALKDLSSSQDSDIRWWAVRTLSASLHFPSSGMIPFLNDPAAEIRAAAALALCERPNEGAIPALTQTLFDKDPITAGLAGNALAKIGSPSTPSLLKVMNDAPLSIRILALRALAEIRDHRAIKIMMECLEEESAVLQYWAQEGLERLGLNMVYIKP